MAVPPLHLFSAKKQQRERIAVISLYDAPSARLCCEAGVDALLVGDSLGNVILGYDSTVLVTMEDMERHAAAVVRGVQRSTRPEVPVIVDLPFGSYHGDYDSLARNGTRLMQTGAQALKLEGGNAAAVQAVERLTQMGAPVMGHLGYTPQSALRLQQVVQGKTARSAMQLSAAARRLEEAGCFAIVLEAMPLEVAAYITATLTIPTIGIGAGPGCDGQVLVWHDLIGLTEHSPFRFVKQFAEMQSIVLDATAAYVHEVHTAEFPAAAHGWRMPSEEHEAWQRELPATPRELATPREDGFEHRNGARPMAEEVSPVQES
jgi:3-methyl-2-oxobutanoate hydroxymethyltransferase